ncbi:N2,N2-dimethylguanosine tRNA methyltransferase [Ophiocordyceps camponoti-floridani]|uniref:tRNA (guanine(26)-N(2))-dimethyltransferase n=1 Tax=Ophiocordyceps camponoti-floridani TaxID=2030778 RepID=A0A8H4Q623_9HYPO|nr:N2,N2-dimethylguanosine tRNA methyltransferase [Ophiocordyceps camponoti-floridani]
MPDDEAPVEELDGKLYRPIKEGKATILVPAEATNSQQVFYNPIQQYNRDLSCLAVKAYGQWTMERRAQSQGSKRAGSRKRKRDGNEGGSTGDQPVVDQAKDESKQSETKLKPRSPFKILDALSASGLRALRYAHELPFATAITANDLSASAAASIKRNVQYNGLQDIISVTNDNALALLYRCIADDLSRKDNRVKFDVIDLDPYGTAAPFFDAALQSVRDDGGLVCITCTDSAVWAGHCYCEKAFALYGGIPVKGPHSHEAGLRLVLHAVAASGAKYGLAIEPLLSLSIDFYSKMFIRVTRRQQNVKFNANRTMLVYSCDQGCGAWETQPMLRSRPAPNKKGSGSFYKHGMAMGPTTDRLCRYCGLKMHVSGPMFAGRLHSPDFVQRILDEMPDAAPDVYGTLPRLEGMLRIVLEEQLVEPELPAGVDPHEAELATVDPYPFYVVPGKLSSIVSCATPPDDMFRGALIHLGYKVGRSHCRPGSIKTNAPWSTIWWVMTEWIRQRSPVKTSKFTPLMAAWKLLSDAGLLGDDAVEGGDGEDGEQGSKMEGVEEDVSTGKGDDEKPGENRQKPSPQKSKPSEEDELRKTLVFDETLARLGRRQTSQRYVSYQMNPESNWGPMTKAKSN